MKNFYRAVRLALVYRWTLIASLGCALMVGLLWGANIGTVYPFVEVTFGGNSLHDWVKTQITTAQDEIDKKLVEIPRLEAQLEADDNADIRRKLRQARARLAAERSALRRAQWLRPYIFAYLPDDAFQTVIIIAAVLLIGTTLKGLFLMGNNILVSRLAQLAIFDLRKMLYRRTLRMDLAVFGSDGSGELMSRFTFDMENVLRGLSTVFGKAIREPLKMLACLIGAAWICWRLLLFSLVLAPIAVFLVSRLARILKRANTRAMEEMSQIYTLLEETFQGIKVVKAFTMERYERCRFHNSSKKYYTKAMRIARYEALTRPVTELMGITTILLALLAGAYLVLRETTLLFGIQMSDRPIELSALLLFYGFLSGVSDPARKLSEVFSRLQRADAACDRIYALVDRESRVCDPINPRPLPRHHRDLVFDNVRFEYKPGATVLQDINLCVPSGETLAVVGPNGCGKSTLVNLLPRFFDPSAGEIRFDGVDIRDVRLRDLRRQIGLVTQETLLFDDTVFNNIRYGCPGATEEQVVEAAKRAHAHRFIQEKLTDGYETIVGPQGSQISGGQRQRIALARAILRDPAILILDEATSQIDLESEQLIHKVLDEFTRDRTTFIITHRMAMLALADRILVMNGGQVVDIGSHRELMSRCQLYARLHDIQFKEIA